MAVLDEYMNTCNNAFKDGSWEVHVRTYCCFPNNLVLPAGCATSCKSQAKWLWTILHGIHGFYTEAGFLPYRLLGSGCDRDCLYSRFTLHSLLVVNSLRIPWDTLPLQWLSTGHRLQYGRHCARLLAVLYSRPVLHRRLQWRQQG